jgi:hypothetical protein
MGVSPPPGPGASGAFGLGWFLLSAASADADIKTANAATKAERSGLTVLSTTIDKFPLDEMVETVMLLLSILGLLSLCLSAFLIVNTISAQMAQQVQQYEALMRAVVDACRGICLASGPVSTSLRPQHSFADRDVTVRADLKHLSPIVADIPWPGTFFEKDQAITSIYGKGPTREEAIELLDKNITLSSEIKSNLPLLNGDTRS